MWTRRSEMRSKMMRMMLMLLFQGPRNTKISIREDEEFLAPYFTCPDLDTLEV